MNKGLKKEEEIRKKIESLIDQYFLLKKTLNPQRVLLKNTLIEQVISPPGCCSAWVISIF